MALGNMALQQFMNGFGSATVAAVTTAYCIDLIMLLPIINLGSAVSTMVAQSKGAGNLTKAQSFCRYGVALNAVISFLLMVVMAAFGGKLVALFGVGAEAASIGSEFFRQISVYYLCFGIASALRGTVEGMGLVLYSSIVGIASLLARIALSYALAPYLGNMAIAHAEGLQWIVMLICYVPYILWQKKQAGSP